MAIKDLSRLNAEHRRALNAFAKKHGRTWRSKLLALRAKGGYGIEGPLVHACNIVGPSGIRAYKVAVANPCACSSKQRNPRGTPKDTVSLWRVRREPLDSGGYTRRSGRYFGTGAPIFRIESPDGDVDYTRADDREEAMAEIRRRHPGAKFYGEPRAKTHARDVREEADEDGEFPSVFIDGNMSPTTQVKLKALLKARAPANYPIEAHYNSEEAKILRRRKVESNGQGEYGKNRFLISRARLPGLLIAMIRSGKDEEYSLASSMLSTMQIDLT